MKRKLIAICFALFSSISMYAFKVDANLKTDDGAQSLFLYSSGKCVVTTSNGARGEGTYDLRGGKIYISWDNGVNQEGSYRMVSNQLKTVYIEGYSYSRTLVLPRR
ncbi:MAG: hypothetical protein J1E02_02540 [Coprobacter sp.]|nr:hypothetical protein [Coprobacter sp.]